jgi:hypothetical protein
MIGQRQIGLCQGESSGKHRDKYAHLNSFSLMGARSTPCAHCAQIAISNQATARFRNDSIGA